MMIGGREDIAVHLESLRDCLSALTTSMLDFEAADGIAYLYGIWDAREPTAVRGRMATWLPSWSRPAESG